MSGCVLRFFLNLPRHWSNWKRKIQLVIPSWWIQTPKPEPKEWKEMRCHLVSMPVLVCSLSITRIHAWEEDDLHWFRKKFGSFLKHPGAFTLLLQCVSFEVALYCESSPCSSPSYLNHLKMALHSFAWFFCRCLRLGNICVTYQLISCGISAFPKKIHGKMVANPQVLEALIQVVQAKRTGPGDWEPPWTKTCMWG